MNLIFSHKLLVIFLSFFILGLIGVPNSQAAEKKDKSARRAAQQMQQIKQQFEQEKAAMQTQFDTQKKEMEAKLQVDEDEAKKLEVSLVTEKRKNRTLEANLAAAKTEKAETDTKLQLTQTTLDATQKNLAQLTGKFEQALADLKVNDGQRKLQLSNLAQTSQSLQACIAKNDKLYHFGTEMIGVYDNPSTYEAAMRKEKFTQLKRVELENILQDYRDKIDEQRISANNNS